MNSSGMTLIEITVAFALLTIGILVLVAGQLSALRWGTEARTLQIVTDIALAELELQRSLKTGADTSSPCRTFSPPLEPLGVEGEEIDCLVERTWCDYVAPELVCDNGRTAGPAIEIRVTVTAAGQSPLTLQTLTLVGG
jgi:type II secretory pathway pseudopilin PulG